MTRARTFITSLVAALGVAAATCSLWGAPAPQPRPPRPLARADLVGTWSAVWDTHACVISLGADGRYLCWWPGEQIWHGSWHWGDGVLTIHERLVSDDVPHDPRPLRFVRQPGGEFTRPPGHCLRLERHRHQ